MKTANDVLSFEDIQTHDDHLSDLIDGLLQDRPQYIKRFIHTFLEWDLYNKCIYNLGWTLKYTAGSQEDQHDPIMINIRVDTLQEAETVAGLKVSALLGKEIRLEKLAEYSTLVNNLVQSPKVAYYTVADEIGNYQGTIKLEQSK